MEQGNNHVKNKIQAKIPRKCHNREAQYLCPFHLFDVFQMTLRFRTAFDIVRQPFNVSRAFCFSTVYVFGTSGITDLKRTCSKSIAQPRARRSNEQYCTRHNCSLTDLTLVLLNPDMCCLCKQCRSRSDGFFRSQLIWICTVSH